MLGNSLKKSPYSPPRPTQDYQERRQQIMTSRSKSQTNDRAQSTVRPMVHNRVEPVENLETCLKSCNN